MIEQVNQEVCSNFNKISWHDSKLRQVSLKHLSETDIYEVTIGFELIQFTAGKANYIPMELKFDEVRILHTDLDLLGMKYCGGDTSSGRSEPYSDFLRRAQIEEVPDFYRPQEEPLAELKYFRIDLIDPSGEINVIAKDFKLIGTLIPQEGKID